MSTRKLRERGYFSYRTDPQRRDFSGLETLLDEGKRGGFCFRVTGLWPGLFNSLFRSSKIIKTDLRLVRNRPGGEKTSAKLCDLKPSASSPDIVEKP